MAYVFSHRRFDGGDAGVGAALAWTLKETLKAAGWVVTRSSDGSTHYPAGDGITHEGSGTGGMLNNRAWFVARQPALVAGHIREVCLQRMASGANEQWRIKWAVTSAFSSGAPSATVTPTADDQQLVHGGGTDASPTFATLLVAPFGGPVLFEVMADSAAPYGFGAFAVRTSSRGVAGQFFCDPVQGGGIAVDGDSDPYVLLAASHGSITAQGRCHMGHGTPGQAWVNASSGWTANPPPNPDGRNYLRTVTWAATGTGGGTKGLGSLLQAGCAGRVSGETLSVASPRDRYIFGDWALPWDGSTPVVS